MRALLGCTMLLLAACQGGGDAEAAAAEQVAQADTVIECAVNGAATFERECPVEKAEIDGAKFLTVRHPDGGFRRFEILTDGHGLAVADGADDAKLAVEGDILGVAVARDRYRFPVTLKSDDAAQ